MLLALGVGSFVADMAIPFVWFIPGTVDPDSPSIIEINKAMQRGLSSLGYKRIVVNGVLDRETAAALDQVSGPRGAWMQKPFFQILGDILSAMRDPDYAAHKIRASSMGGYFEYEGAPPGPLPGPMVGLPPGPMGMDGIFDFFSSSPVISSTLTFGQGVKDKSIIVPIPKKSGATFQAFKNLQRQINRVLSVTPRGGKIAEDGIIGDEVLRGLRSIKNAMGVFGIPLKFETTLDIANRSISLANALKAFADSKQASQTANTGVASTPASASEPTPAPMTQAQAATFSVGPAATMKKYLPFVLVAGGIAYFAATTKKKKGKRKS